MIKINVLATFCLLLVSFVSCNQEKDLQRPNILFCIADDQSFPHAGAYGCEWIKTPAFDWVASRGLLFTNAYTPNAKCAPSRACIITGRNSWQLEAAANHVPFFPAKFKTYAEALRDNGYFVGYTAKGWAPGNPGVVNGKKRGLLGPSFSKIKTIPPTDGISKIDYASNFKAFLKANKEGKPFCFWYGSTEPHRAYEFKSGVDKGGKSLDEIGHVFGFWPDNDTVRYDLLDYAFEIEYFDKHLSRMIEELKENGMLDNTLIVVTADNGMPFPRVKGQEYELSNHLPLAMMWPKGIVNPGRVIEDFVSFTDFAPTFLDIAGIPESESGMQEIEGKSLMPVLFDEPGAKGRGFMVIGKERHDVGRPNDQGYPVRGIVTGEFLYLRNYHPERWPAGNPETGYMNCDGSPTKTWILNDRRKNGESWLWDMNFGKNPSEELYKISEDPECVNNLADDSQYAVIKAGLVEQMDNELKAEGDPRILGNGGIFDTYPYAQKATRNFYNRFMAGENVKAGWINQTDIEKEKLE
ncbi:MAG: sulfatase [Chlorobi bacterium]|nr:sulfatase [Chlorobiota bacterium]